MVLTKRTLSSVCMGCACNSSSCAFSTLRTRQKALFNLRWAGIGWPRCIKCLAAVKRYTWVSAHGGRSAHG